MRKSIDYHAISIDSVPRLGTGVFHQCSSRERDWNSVGENCFQATRRAETDLTPSTSGDLSPRQAAPPDPDITIARSSFIANYDKCGSQQASKLKRWILEKRQSGTEYPLSDDPPATNQDLGPKTDTFGQGETTLITYAEARDEGFTIAGTVGINACSVVLIVARGSGGAVFGDHLSPIEANDDGTPKEDSFDAFQSRVQSEIIDELQDPENAPFFQGATMYVVTPNNQVGENTILGNAANTLGFAQVAFTYTPVDRPTAASDAYEASGQGSAWVNISDNDNPVVTIFGQIQNNGQ